MKTVLRTFHLKSTAAITCCGKLPSDLGPHRTDRSKTHTFDVDPATSLAYDTDYGEATVSIFGEWERLPVGGVFPNIGDDFEAQLILTEESFHGSGGQYAGGWAAAMSADISYNALVIEAENASIRTAGGIIGGNWCL
jgi:hypothetical protein